MKIYLNILGNSLTVELYDEDGNLVSSSEINLVTALEALGFKR